jgi:hypothetical protein
MEIEYELKDWINSINFTKENLILDDSDNIKSYPPYIINRCLSAHLDTILFANEMNLNNRLDKDMQYLFYLNSLRKKKRYSSWINKNKIENLEYIKQYYGYNDEKASQILNILNKDQINFIKQKLDIGGTK